MSNYRRTCRDCGDLLGDDSTGKSLCPDCEEESEYQKMWESVDDEDEDE